MVVPEYVSSGQRNYGHQPIPLNQRGRWEFQIIHRGSATPFFSHPQVFEKSVPRLYCFSPESIHGWTSGTREPSVVSVIHFPTIPLPVVQLIGGRSWFSLKISPDDSLFLRDRIQFIHGDIHSPHPISALFMSNEVLWRIVGLFHSDLSPDGQVVTPHSVSTGEYEFLVRRILAWYDEHLQENPRVEDLPDLFFSSKSTINRAFSATLGLSPKKALLRLRMKRAELLLQTTTFSISNLAYNLGYTDPGVFSRDFHRYTGTTPGEYRKNLSRDGV